MSKASVAPSAGTWKAPIDTSEIDRLNKLLVYYEDVNKQQIIQIETYEAVQIANNKRLLEQEKTIRTHLKKIRSLEDTIKFDKIATEGLRKKFNLIEYDVKEFQHSNEMMKVEREEHISRINELEIDLYSNRSDKLKLMHENAQYKRKNDELIESEALSRADCVLARKELLDKLQNLDNIYNDHETLKRTLYIQNEEMMNMSREVFTSKQSYVSINDQVIDMENMTLEYNKTIDVLQHEISRLRKELLMTTSTTTSMSSSSSSLSSSLPSTASSRVTSSAAATTAYGTMSRSNRVSSAITNSAYSDGLNGPYTHSRRPMTLHGLSRERNRDAMSHASNSPLKAPGTNTAAVNKRASTSSSSGSNNHNHMNNPHHHQQEYHYVDLQEHFEKGRLDRSSSSQQSQRNDVLKQYDDAMFKFNKTINSDKSNNNSPNHKHSGVNDESTMSFDGSTMYSPSSSIVGEDFIDNNNQSSSSRSNRSSSNRRVSSSSFMCSPISTPQRPINTPIGAIPASMHNQIMNNNNRTTAAAAAAKILPTSINSRPNTVSVHTQYGGRGDEDGYGVTDGGNMISKSLNDLKKCYSMPSIHHPNSSSKLKKGKSFINNSCIRIESSADPNINITSATTSNTTTTSSTSTAQESSSLNNGNDSPVPINIHDEADDNQEYGQQDGNHLHVHHHSDNVNDQSTTDDDTSIHVTIVESHDDYLFQPPISGSTRSQVKSKQRTLYVGSGLGMKHDAALNSQLDNLNIGSAQYKLKMILGDRFD